MRDRAFRAVLFDFGGVITSSPFEAFRQFETERGLPAGFLQNINRDNPDENAWARFERGELSPAGFDEAFSMESRKAGHEVRGLEVAELVYGQIRPRMMQAVTRCRARYFTACLTNNFNRDPGKGPTPDEALARDWRNALALFDEVIESSKVGIRKPDPRFFELACERLSIQPAEAVFLDDIGANLKPARMMGMHTIKVVDLDTALNELGSLLGLEL